MHVVISGSVLSEPVTLRRPETKIDNCFMCVFAGFESILEGICGQMLLGDLTLHDGGFYAH